MPPKKKQPAARQYLPALPPPVDEKLQKEFAHDCQMHGFSSARRLALKNPELNVNHPTASGRNVLGEACIKGDAELLKFLLTLPGINVNDAGYSARPLMMALNAEKKDEIIRVLVLDERFDPNQEYFGFTALEAFVDLEKPRLAFTMMLTPKLNLNVNLKPRFAARVPPNSTLSNMLELYRRNPAEGRAAAEEILSKPEEPPVEDPQDDMPSPQPYYGTSPAPDSPPQYLGISPEGNPQFLGVLPSYQPNLDEEFMKFCGKGDLESAREIAELVDVNHTTYSGENALTLAITNGHTDVVMFLLSLDRIDVDRGRPDDPTFTPLHRAIATGKEGVVMILAMDPRVNVNTVSAGETPFSRAISGMRERMAISLMLSPRLLDTTLSADLAAKVPPNRDLARLIALYEEDPAEGRREAYKYFNLQQDETRVFTPPLGRPEYQPSPSSTPPYQSPYVSSPPARSPSDGTFPVLTPPLGRPDPESPPGGSFYVETPPLGRPETDPRLNKEFADSCGRGDLEAARGLLGRVDINDAGDLDGYNALAQASQNNRSDVVRFLLTLDDIDVNRPTPGEGLTPLKVAVKNNHVDVVEVLVEDPRVDVNSPGGGGTPFEMAIRGNFRAVALALMGGSKDLDVNLSPQTQPFADDLAEIIEIYQRDKIDGRFTAFIQLNTLRIQPPLTPPLLTPPPPTPRPELTFANFCGTGDLSSAKELAAQVDINDSGSPDASHGLAQASKNNHANVVKYLLGLPGIDVNRRAHGSSGRTALELAIAHKHEIIVRILATDPRVDVNLSTGTSSPFEQAVLTREIRLTFALMLSPRALNTQLKPNVKPSRFISDMIILYEDDPAEARRRCEYRLSRTTRSALLLAQIVFIQNGLLKVSETERDRQRLLEEEERRREEEEYHRRHREWQGEGWLEFLDPELQGTN